jgi:ABC-type molybdate transport system permease subunit
VVRRGDRRDHHGAAAAGAHGARGHRVGGSRAGEGGVHGIIAGLVLAFARALGEFGATLMLAGNIPGKTTTVPLAIYTAVQTGEMGEAVVLVLALTTLSCLVLVLAGRLGARAT